MAVMDGQIRERVRFLGQERERLRAVRGQALYETLGGLGLTHGQFFKALGTNVDDYCAQEFGVDLRRITVERFFQTDPNAKWLFPDIVREAVLTGMRTQPVYPQLIIGDEPISGTVFDVPYMVESEEDEVLHTVAEGGVIPESNLTYGDRSVRLSKLGRGFIASYEVVRRMSVDLLRVHLQRIGERLGRSLDAVALNVLLNGDGSGPATAPVVLNTVTANTWDYRDLVRAYLKLSTEHHFTPTHLLVSPATAEEILQFDEIADGTLFDFARTGNLPTPLGVKLLPVEAQPDHKITLLDAGYALQKLTEQDLLIESDKLINQQWDRTFLTVVTNFAIIYEKARVVLNSDWS
jgi:hypothetical protein